jgi:CheY-like chemotaxis protein
MKKIPLFYFPTTICWIDDNQDFLNATNTLFTHEYNSVAFVDSKEALNFLNDYSSPFSAINFTREFIESDVFDTRNHLPVDINISEIIKLANNSSVRHEISIIVVDNNMPNLRGIDICKQLKDAAYKKILLTGETSHEEVINAFNDGLIDKYIPKNIAVPEKLESTIQNLTRQFFVEKTKNLLAHLETSRLTPLSDPIFIEFFYNWCSLNNITEFYLINKNGSYLTKNKDGKTIYLIIMSEHAKKEFVSLNDEFASDKNMMLDEISAGKVIPFFGLDKESWEVSYDEWDKYAYPAKIISGREKYFWSEIKG